MSVSLPKVRVSGRLEQLARERHAQDLETASARGLVYDAEEAERAVAFFPRYCRHTKGEWAGKPLELAPFQAENIRQIFGWKREDGTRRFRSAWWEIARKNGKTTIAAGVGLKLLVADHEEGGEVYWTATKRDQALYGHTACEDMVRRSPDLQRFIKVGRWNLSCARLGSKMEPLSSDQDTADGLSPSGDLRDEVHEWKDHRLAAKLDTATGARRQPLTLEITTAGVYDKTGVGWTHHEYATKVLEGTTPNDSLFAFIAAADEGDDPYDPATWWKANPNLGVAPKLEYMAKMADDCRTGKLAFNDFLRFHLNVWTRQVKRWLDVAAWNECDSRPLEPEDVAGRPCWAGLDLSRSAVEGLTAWVLVWPREDGGIDILPRFWIPEAQLDALVKQGKVHLLDWVREGFLVVIPGAVIDQAFVKRQILEDSQRYDLQDVCYDEYDASMLATDLETEEGLSMVKIPQGIRHLSEPSKTFESLILSRKIRHGGNPVMAAHVAAATCRMDANGNIAPDKSKATDYIDGVVATITALARARYGESSGGTYLDHSDPVVLR